MRHGYLADSTGIGGWSCATAWALAELIILAFTPGGGGYGCWPALSWGIMANYVVLGARFQNKIADSQLTPSALAA